MYIPTQEEIEWFNMKDNFWICYSINIWDKSINYFNKQKWSIDISDDDYRYSLWSDIYPESKQDIENLIQLFTSNK